jgi:endonuclease/exonuclease/phosphatase family metal-dependent hydrolase
MQQETPVQHNKTGRIGRLLLLVNACLALLLLASQALMNVSPVHFWALELITSVYPILALANLLFVVLWLTRKSRFAFLSIFVLLAGYRQIGHLVQFGNRVDPDAGGKAIKVISYNVRSFDLYNWTGNAKTRKQIFQMLEEEKPAILCLQEYYSCDEGEFQNTKDIRKSLNLPHKSIHYSNTVLETHHWGLAIFSSFPIVNEGTLSFKKGKSNFIQFADLLINNDTIRVYNMHLQSNHFKKQDYEFIENPDDTVHQGLIKGSKSILRKLRKAVVMRSRQADELAEHIRQCPHPVIVCGDFNDTPFTYTYQTARGELKDAFTEMGSGFGGSYTELPLPLRIDYVMHSQEINTHSFAMRDNHLSDHYPLIVEILLP